MSGSEKDVAADLAASLAVMTLRPHVSITLPGVDGTYPEVTVDSIWVQESAVALDTVPTAPQFEGEPVTDFTTEMARAFLEAPVMETAVGTVAEAVPAEPDLEYATQYTEYEQVTPEPEVAPVVVMNVDLDEQYVYSEPLSAVASASSSYEVEKNTEPAEYVDPLAGFDPSKYIGLGAGVPQATMSAPPAPEPQEHEEDRQEQAPTTAIKSLYEDIQPGSAGGGAKNSREAMQMLRELAVLKER
jgi:hypothetical protein